MAIVKKCPCCRRQLEIQAELIGSLITCPVCDQDFVCNSSDEEQNEKVEEKSNFSQNSERKPPAGLDTSTNQQPVDPCFAYLDEVRANINTLMNFKEDKAVLDNLNNVKTINKIITSIAVIALGLLACVAFHENEKKCWHFVSFFIASCIPAIFCYRSIAELVTRGVPKFNACYDITDDFNCGIKKQYQLKNNMGVIYYPR